MSLPKALVSALVRMWPFANGSGRFLDRFASGLELGSLRTTCTTTDGFEMTVLPDDLVGRHLILSGRFDRSPIEKLLSHARDGDVIADIGANIGYVSCLSLSNVQGSRVIAVEPNPIVLELLRANLAQFPADRYEIREVALSDHAGPASFEASSENLGGGSLSSTGTIQVQLMEAAKLFASFEKLDLIKIDVEGHEEPIFRSIEAELVRLKPRAILFEEQLGKAGPDGPIGSILNRCGYKVFGVNKKLFSTSLVPIRSAAECRFNDYLALPDDSC